MKRPILAILILAAALLSVSTVKERVARAESARGLAAHYQLSLLDDPQNEEITEEFHQTYPLNANGRVSIENINGGVRISVWDQNEVKVDAVKRAYTKEKLDEAKVDVNARADSVRIRTEYPERNQSFSDGESRRHNNPATVEYSLTIPRKARIDSADLVNGSLDIEGVEGDVKAACVNGHIKARGLTGDVKLSTVNGGGEATITRLEESKSTSLNSVNGSIVLTIPSDSNGQVKANTIHGASTNALGLQLNEGEYVGHDLSGQIGNGGAPPCPTNRQSANSSQRRVGGQPGP